MTGTDKCGFNPGGGDRPGCMSGGDYFETKPLPGALPQGRNTVLTDVQTQLSKREAQPQDDYIVCWADMEMKCDSTPGNK
ncbi:hypothetical protein J3456_06400 [Sulfitobacter sp. NFXS29]|uniref:hypothetical protein n=1 Tax=Sulfitobacter sp. NFXS29 TaxID=2818438 RepID=UPI0032DE2EC1